MIKWFDKYAYFVFPLLSLAFFFPTFQYGYVTDFLSWLIKYENGSWSDVLTCFDYPGLHHFFHLVNFSVFKLVGKSFFGWYFVMSSMHGLNAYLCYSWLKKMNTRFELSLAWGFLFFVPLVFMLSPYAIEPVVWKACLHYLLCMGLVLMGFLFLTDFLFKKKAVWKVHLCFILALFTLEISLAVPFIYFIYWVSYLATTGKWHLFKKFFIDITIPQFVIIYLYFYANKWILGEWVGHYGAEKHLNFDLTMMCSHAFQYLFKYLFSLHYLPFRIKMPIYQFIDNPLTLLIIIGFSLLCVWWIITKRNKTHRSSYLLLFSYVAFFMALFPIANLFFFKTQLYENDRYGYFSSLFIYLFVGLVIWSFPRLMRTLMAFLFAGILLFCSIKTIIMAHKAGIVTHGLVENFDFYDEPEIVILSKPDNLGGLQLFRDLSGKSQSFIESLYHFKGRNYNGHIEDLAQINILNTTDRVGVDIIDSMTLKVKNPQNGSWFWRNGFGMKNFETDEFKLQLHGWYYLLTIKNPDKHRIFIYADGIEWKKVNF